MDYNSFRKLLRDHQQSAPVDLISIAKALKLKIWESPKLPTDISGQIIKNREDGSTTTLSGESGYFIIINKAHHLNRKRFTIAHEIAHYILHKQKIGDGITDSAMYRSILSSPDEKAANDLAAEILMPWTLLTEELNKAENDITQLPKVFQVSPAAMSIRLGVPIDYHN